MPIEQHAVMDTSYTLVLTRGTHTVAEAEARKIKDALNSRQTLVDVAIEFTETLREIRETTLIVSHIVALVKVPNKRDAAGPIHRENVSSFSAKRQRRLGASAQP